ncbi:MAG TPA: efflux RND transporter periplasmic adaptor subunit [Pyrinomonadaceae bacterium]|nr:efflux RND transporter periplasmic adaptor subunit [Pyrinomonadaceae bacterium]
MNFKFQVSGYKFGRLAATAVGGFLLLAVLLTAYGSRFTAWAHGDEDHSADKKTETTASGGATGVKITSVTAERNIQTDAGQFNIQLTRTPSDPRAGETAQFVVRLSEKVEGGFGGGEPAPLENATVKANITNGGANIAENVAAQHEGGNAYRLAYTFKDAGDYKVVFNAATADNRSFSADFPVSVSKAPMNWTFWVGLAILSLLTLGALGFVFAKSKGADKNQRVRRVAPFAAAALVLFALSTFALAYFAPPRQSRVITAAAATTAETAPQAEVASALTGTVSIPKESQILFGIKTQPVEVRQITSGLKVTGVVRARPDARAVVVPPVAGRIVLRQGLSIGSAVGRGEQIGSVEQILDVSGQTELESQRLEVEAQQREVESKRLEIRNTVLQLQGQQAEQRANANQARTQLAQANRELRRSENLLEVGAVPRKRVEEAQTAVKVAEQSVASAEQQVKLLDNQIKQTSAGQNIFRSPKVNQPSRSFPLTAPITGIVNDIKATSGQQVETGTELLSISNLSTVLIEANVFERDLPIVRESTRASFTSAALSGEVYTIGTRDGDGRLVSIGQTVNAETRAIPVIYEVINPLNRLRDGNFVEITIDTSGDAQVLAVPKTAVIREQGETFVYVLTGGETFERRAVALGAEGADFYEVKSGLKESDRVVVEGVYQLRTTQPAA